MLAAGCVLVASLIVWSACIAGDSSCACAFLLCLSAPNMAEDEQRDRELLKVLDPDLAVLLQ